MFRFRSSCTLLAAAALVAAGTLALSAALATAAPHLGASNGRYAGTLNIKNGQNLVLFKIRARKVYDLTFQVNLQCHNDDDNTDYVRSFKGRDAPHKRVPSSDLLRLRWSESSGGRDGRISAEIDLRRSDLFSVNVTTAGEIETCFGDAVIRIKRSRVPL